MACPTWLLVAILVWRTAVAHAQELTKKEVASAKRIYETKCVRCHKAYEPRDYSPEEWRLWMLKMSKKAKLKSSEDKLLKRYWEVLRTGKPQKAPWQPLEESAR